MCEKLEQVDFQGVDRKLVTTENNLTEGDPRFVDGESMNFQLRDDSPAYELGFERIPVERIGPTKEFQR